MSNQTLANFNALQRNGVEIKQSSDQALPMREAHDEEASLVAGLKKREEVAFTGMVKRYQRSLLSVALRITGNPEDAEEAVQEVFLKVFQNIESFRGESRLRTWLTRITMNEALMKIRRKRGISLSLDEGGEDGIQADIRQLKASGYTPEETCCLLEIQALMRSLISQIGLPYQSVMQLSLHQDLSQAEMAKHLKLTPAMVRSRLFRGRRQLRDALERHCARQKQSTIRNHAPSSAKAHGSRSGAQPIDCSAIMYARSTSDPLHNAVGV